MMTFYLVNITGTIMYEVRAKILKAQEMGVKPASPNLVASRFGDGSPAKTPQQWAKHQYAAP